MDQLLNAIEERPDDHDTWSVYGDLLQSLGDPRGELVSLMLQRELHPTPRLFEAQRRYLLRHGTALAHPADTVLRRGFVAEMRFTDPNELAALDEPALRFVDTVRIEIQGEQWDEWRLALAGRRPWRWLTVELSNPPATLRLEPLFEGCARLESVRLTFSEAVELELE